MIFTDARSQIPFLLSFTVATPTTPAPFRTNFACIFYPTIHLFYWVLMFSTTAYIPPCSARSRLLANSIYPVIISVLAQLRRPADRRHVAMSKIDFRWKVAREELLHRLGPFPSRRPSRIHQLSHRHACRGGLVSSAAVLPRRVGQLKGSDVAEGKDGSPIGINPHAFTLDSICTASRWCCIWVIIY